MMAVIVIPQHRSRPRDLHQDASAAVHPAPHPRIRRDTWLLVGSR